MTSKPNEGATRLVYQHVAALIRVLHFRAAPHDVQCRSWKETRHVEKKLAHFRSRRSRSRRLEGDQRILNVSVPSASNLEVTVQWNDPANSVSATLIGVGCPNYRAAADCQERRSFPRSGREFREGVISNPGASGTYHLVVENAGPGVETIHVTAALLNWQPAPVRPSPNPYWPPPYPTDHPLH